LAPAKLAENASNLLSSLTHQAGLVLLPNSQAQSFRQLEFLPLSNQRVLAILVLGEQEVQNRIIHTDRDYSEAELQQAAGFVNHHFAGKSVATVQSELLQSMKEDRSTIDQLMQSAIDFASQALADVEEQGRDYILAGQSNLLANDHENMDQLRELFEAFQQKKDILHLMERCALAEGVQIFIGDESGYGVLDDFSLITAPYQQQGQSIGVLGVIGPTRMAYERVVPMVDITAKLLGAAMKN
jgi:heat-inducible transcriptional repressor